ncbi:MAG: exodeoxyribonuclease VII small subunit [Cyanobium sp.]
MARSRRHDSPPSPDREPAAAVDASTNGEAGAADLSFNEARAALELVLAQLQASDLDVEVMAGLYQRGRLYAQRCEAILAEVEQEVLVWDDLANPEVAQVRYDPDSDPF